MGDRKPRVVILAGPNGAGKSTAARLLLQGRLKVDEFVNADAIAQGLSGFWPERAAIRAGRVMLQRLKELAEARADFAFETTLAGRHFARWIEGLKAGGYDFHVVFLWLPTPEMAIRRVAERVRLGGHSVPEETIRRRYHGGLHNFFEQYQALASRWRFYDNSARPKPRLIAGGSGARVQSIADAPQWARIFGAYAHADEPPREDD